MLRTVLLSAVASICLSGVSMAAEYFVSAGGADENAGSREAPWRTLAKANATLAPGDRVTLLDGTHDGIIEPGQSGEPGRPITYRAENPLMAVITGGPASDGDRTCVRLKDRSHIIVDGLYMLPTARGWMKLDRANNCVIRNCRMENAIGHYSPITCTDCHYNRYEHLATASAPTATWAGTCGTTTTSATASSTGCTSAAPATGRSGFGSTARTMWCAAAYSTAGGDATSSSSPRAC